MKMGKAVRHLKAKITLKVETPSCDRDNPIGWTTKGRNLFEVQILVKK